MSYSANINEEMKKYLARKKRIEAASMKEKWRRGAIYSAGVFSLNQLKYRRQ